MFNKLDHVAIAVKNIEAALPLWIGIFSSTVQIEEVVANGTTKLVHLDAGGCQIQLVQPLVPDHPIYKWINENGEGLHHLCYWVENIEYAIQYAMEKGLVEGTVNPHQGTMGKKAFFLDREKTNNILIEITG